MNREQKSIVQWVLIFLIYLFVGGVTVMWMQQCWLALHSRALIWNSWRS